MIPSFILSQIEYNENMFEPLKHLFPKLHSIKVYALVGKSGTGKSYRSQMIAERFRISLIIDDGILIRRSILIAGKSAKQAGNFIAAMKCALFRDEEHRSEVMKALQKEKFRRILIIGTSEKMISVITERLNLPAPYKVFNIEDFSTHEEIETALRTRYTEGKHVIPLPAIEVTRTAPDIVYDSIQVFLKRLPFSKKNRSFEKTLVKPGFSIREAKVLSRNVFLQMINQCLYDYDNTIKINALEVQFIDGKYKLQIGLRSPSRIQRNTIPEIREYIVDSLEKYSSIQIADASVTVDEWSSANVQEELRKMNEQIVQVKEININQS